MRILAVADLHYALRQFDWVGERLEGFDLLVLAGDLLDLGSAVDLDVQELVVQKYLRRYASKRMLRYQQVPWTKARGFRALAPRTGRPTCRR